MAADNKDVGTSKLRAKRKSSLEVLAQSTALPSVETSLEDFISRANQTQTSAENWKAAEVEAKAAAEARKEADALRWKAAEHQLREGGERETALRRQLDGLQGRLAEAEARAAVATSEGANDGMIADLKLRLSRAGEQLSAAEEKNRELANEVQIARASSELIKAPPPSISAPSTASNEAAEARARLADAKAAKALAAARAAAAGLTINPADLAAIESGLVVPQSPPKRGMPWIGMAGGLVGGLAIMFAVLHFTGHSSDAPAASPPTATPVEVAPVAAPIAHPTVTPIVTPIDDSPTPPTAAPSPATTTTTITTTTTTAPAPAPAAPPMPTVELAPAPAPIVHHSAPVHHAAPKPAAKPAAAPAQKPSGGIVDPF